MSNTTGNLRAEIVSIGEELLSGDTNIVDTNSIYITKQLRSIGLRVLFKTTVGDNEQLITDVLKLALSRAEVVITTGGLGPTVDDMTRQAVANAVGRKLEFRQELLDDIAAKFARFNSRMSENNRIQAMIPEGAIVVDNPVGTAPSFIVEQDGHTIVSLPGVPREMKFLMEESIMPYLREKVGVVGIIKNRVIRTAGIGESLVDEKVGDLEKLENPVVGLAAHSGQTDIRIAARAATEAEADVLIAEVEAEVRKRLGSFIFGVDQDSLESAFVTAAKGAGATIGVVEVGTQGLFRQRIQDHPEAGGLLLPPHADGDPIMAILEASESGPARFKDTAERAAKAIFAQNNCKLAIAIISDERATAIAMTDGSDVRSRSYAYGGIAAGGAEWATGWAMSMGWHMLISRSLP